MAEALVYLSTNNSREILLTVLDPLGLLESPWPDWQKGDSGNFIDTATDSYIEDLGVSPDAWNDHLVVVNDTRVTLNDAYSLHQTIAIDNSGNTHITWVDRRAYGFDIDVNYEIYYTHLRLSSAGA